MPDEGGIREMAASAASGTPEPERAERNIIRLIEESEHEFPFHTYLREIARLFSMSQFLANHSVKHPGDLASALKGIKRPVTRSSLERDAASALKREFGSTEEAIAALRLFKRRHLILISLRDVLGESEPLSSMDELTELAEAVIRHALDIALNICISRYGEPPKGGGGLCLIALGKLGGEELNYSSDVDLMAVYGGGGGGKTAGVPHPSGVRGGRIEEHEFYVKAVEIFSKLLAASTGDGVAYRVDFRLRPQGAKGELALPLEAARTYYESWGRVWERMVLLRARPVAGDLNTGQSFMDSIEPFVWKGALDYSEVEEIRAMKKKIDSTFLKDDIKRGWGGIREAEFFVQTFQLFYGPENPQLRTHRLFNAMQALRWMGMVPEKEIVRLWDNYLHLRRTEHLLQMMDDVQTHKLPATREETDALGRKMGFQNGKRFLSDLRVRRMQVKRMYNSLLGTREDADAEALDMMVGDFSDEELSGLLAFRGARDSLGSMKRIREMASAMKSPKERSLIRKTVPGLIERALGAASPDRALAGLEAFFSRFGAKEAHLTAFMEERELADGMINLFSLSPLLTRAFLSDPRHIDLFIEESRIRKTLRRMITDISRTGEGGEPPEALTEALIEAFVEHRVFEEIRLGIFFLSNIIGVRDLKRYITHLAEAIIRRVVAASGGAGGISVMGFGKLGGREMTYGSDLDIVFVSGETGGGTGVEPAHSIIKALTAYTARGQLFSVDTRLRPDGTKGALVKDIPGFRAYYMEHARGWEIQALLRARPVAGDEVLGKEFLKMARDVVLRRAGGIARVEIEEMRRRMVAEVSKEREGMDVKLGPGGLGEIEFFVQGLQLENASAPGILVQGTLPAIHRLRRAGVVSRGDAKYLAEAYEYLSRLQTFLRLNETGVVREDGVVTNLAATFMGEKGAEAFLEKLRGLRNGVLAITGDKGA